MWKSEKTTEVRAGDRVCYVLQRKMVRSIVPRGVHRPWSSALSTDVSFCLGIFLQSHFIFMIDCLFH